MCLDGAWKDVTVLNPPGKTVMTVMERTLATGRSISAQAEATRMRSSGSGRPDGTQGEARALEKCGRLQGALAVANPANRARFPAWARAGGSRPIMCCPRCGFFQQGFRCREAFQMAVAQRVSGTVQIERGLVQCGGERYKIGNAFVDLHPRRRIVAAL